MTTTEAYAPQNQVEQLDMRGHAVVLDPSLHMDENDQLSTMLSYQGIAAKPIADIEAGSQRFAVVDVSEAPAMVTGVGVKEYRPFSSITPVSDKSPKMYELEEANPYVLLHFGQDGMVTGRAIHAGRPILLGRSAYRKDPESGVFDYGDDTKLSREHLSIELDAATKAITITDLDSSNGTTMHYASQDQQKAPNVPVPEKPVQQPKKRGTEAVDHTEELLERPEFLPIESLRTGNRSFWFSPIIKSASGRDHAIMYANIGTDRKRVIAPRLLYKSNSDGGWRVAFGYDVATGRYVKESQENGFSHYTQETKLAPKIVDKLEKLPVNDDPDGVLESEFLRIFDTQTPSFQQLNTGAKEISYYSDKTVDDKMDIVRGISAGHLDSDALYFVQNRGYKTFKDYVEAMNTQMDAIPGFVPDFTQKPVAAIDREHTLLGMIRIEDYMAMYGDKTIIWSMAQDTSNRTWIDNIRLADAKLTSYGTYGQVFDGGLLTSKPLEYYYQADGLAYDEASRYKGDYNDITPFLKKLSPVKRYLAAKAAQ